MKCVQYGEYLPGGHSNMEYNAWMYLGLEEPFTAICHMADTHVYLLG